MSLRARRVSPASSRSAAADAARSAAVVRASHARVQRSSARSLQSACCAGVRLPTAGAPHVLGGPVRTAPYRKLPGHVDFCRGQPRVHAERRPTSTEPIANAGAYGVALALERSDVAEGLVAEMARFRDVIAACTDAEWVAPTRC